MITHAGCSPEFDDAFDQMLGLTWRPWVGSCWMERPAKRRLLVVAESHYAHGKTHDEVTQNMEVTRRDRNYTRDVVLESLIEDDWDTPTLRNIPKLLFGDELLDRTRFWSEAAFYNFVQRPMNYNEGERPTWEDFYGGWPVFFRVIEMLQPSFCLFIGVEAANAFWHGLKQAGREPYAPELRTKVSRTRGRRAVLEVGEHKVELAFVQHAGRYFSWEGWHGYLQEEHPTLMAWLREERYSAA